MDVGKILRISLIILGFFSTWLLFGNHDVASFQQSFNSNLVDEEPSPTNTTEATATNTQEPTAINTPSPTSTNTSTPLSATSTFTPTPTNTPVPPTLTFTPTASNTPQPPTSTSTNTPLPPTATKTPTPTNTPQPPTATSTNTPLPPTATSTNTPLPPTATKTPTPTNTPSPTATNSPPTISQISNHTIDEDTSTDLIPFTIGDAETPAGNLTLSAFTSNTDLVPLNSIAFSGSGTSRFVKITPIGDKFGSTTIKIQVNDGQYQVSEDFILTVSPVNDPPIIDLNGNGEGTDYVTSFVSQKGKVLIVDSDLQVSDIDSAQLKSATISITNLKDGAAEKLSVDTSGTNLTAAFSSGVLNITGADTKANYQKVLRTTSYVNTKVQPNPTVRVISFILDDGAAQHNSSNIAKSSVAVLNPQISIEKGPDNQTVGSGGTAVFTITADNIGNTDLFNVNVQDPLVPNCERTIGRLKVGESQTYTCNKQNVTSEFINTATVEGRDSKGNRASADDSARVDVENPNVQIIKSPQTQTLLKGGTANFEIFVVNTSNIVDLVEVTVNDPNSPNCDRVDDHPFSNLPADETVQYNCQSTNVTAGFTNVITVTGVNLLTQESVVDSSVAQVELLDLDVQLTAEPNTLPSSGGPVTFGITVNNPGTVDVSLFALENKILGSLLDNASGNWLDNSCTSSPPILIISGGQFACHVTAYINSVPPEYGFEVAATGKDEEENIVTDEGSVSIPILDVVSIQVDLSASKLTVFAPGGSVDELVTIRNMSYTEDITVTSLSHSSLGNLSGIGNCQVPITIPSQESSECQFAVHVAGQIGDSITHTIQVNGESVTEPNLTDNEAVIINVISPNIRQIMMPLVANLYSQTEEENDHPCAAYPIYLNQPNFFLPDDENDWFYIDLDSAMDINILLEDFSPKDGQLAVWSGESCANLTVLHAHNANFKSTKTVSFPAESGRYYIWITNFDNIAYQNPYHLIVSGSPKN